MKVFVVTACDYGEFFVVAVFASRADAEACVETSKENDKKARRRGRYVNYQYDIVEEDVK